jgi:hypothetical protein
MRSYRAAVSSGCMFSLTHGSLNSIAHELIQATLQLKI